MRARLWHCETTSLFVITQDDHKGDLSQSQRPKTQKKHRKDKIRTMLKEIPAACKVDQSCDASQIYTSPIVLYLMLPNGFNRLCVWVSSTCKRRLLREGLEPDITPAAGFSTVTRGCYAIAMRWGKVPFFPPIIVHSCFHVISVIQQVLWHIQDPCSQNIA